MWGEQLRILRSSRARSPPPPAARGEESTVAQGELASSGRTATTIKGTYFSHLATVCLWRYGIPGLVLFWPLPLLREKLIGRIGRASKLDTLFVEDIIAFVTTLVQAICRRGADMLDVAAAWVGVVVGLRDVLRAFEREGRMAEVTRGLRVRHVCNECGGCVCTGR